MSIEKGFKISEMYAYVATDEDGTDGILGHIGPQGPEPMIGADKERIDSLRSFAIKMAVISGEPIRKVRFTQMVVEEVIDPSALNYRVGVFTFIEEKTSEAEIVGFGTLIKGSKLPDGIYGGYTDAMKRLGRLEGILPAIKLDDTGEIVYGNEVYFDEESSFKERLAKCKTVRVISVEDLRKQYVANAQEGIDSVIDQLPEELRGIARTLKDKGEEAAKEEVAKLVTK